MSAHNVLRAAHRRDVVNPNAQATQVRSPAMFGCSRCMAPTPAVDAERQSFSASDPEISTALPIRARVPRETPGRSAFGGVAIMTVVIQGGAHGAGDGVVTIRADERFRVKRGHRLGRVCWNSALISRTPAMYRQPAATAPETLRELSSGTDRRMAVALPTRKSTTQVGSSSRAYAGRSRHRRSLPTPSARVSRGLDDPCRVIDVSRGTWIRG